MGDSEEDQTSSPTPNTEFDPELDLLDRYDRMVQTQIDTLEGIDDKASTTMRVLVLLLGVLLTAITLLIDSDGVVTDLESSIASMWFAAGVGLLLLSLAFSIHTYLSSRFLHGPSEDFGRVMAENRVTPEDYRSQLLAGYADAIDKNRQVVRTNSKRFRNCLLSLLYGIVALSIAIAIFVFSLSFWYEVALTIVVSLLIGRTSRYFLDQHYLVLNPEE